MGLEYILSGFNVLAEAIEYAVKELEAQNGKPVSAAPAEESGQVSMSSMAEQSVLDALRRCQPDSLTPMEAMGLLYEWKKALS